MSFTQVSTELSHIGPRAVGQALDLPAGEVGNYRDLAAIGIGLRHVPQMAAALAMDDAQALTTTASITTPVQFLQTWLPGFVRVVTKARKIDELIGITTAGSWEDEEVVQGVMELTGQAIPYGDFTNVPFSNWNANFERRTVVRFEQGLKIGTLEEARAARMRANSAQGKREASGLALEIQRNRVGFYGYNSGNNRTYGFLNDPNLPAYVTVPNGAGGSPLWTQKTFFEIVADIVAALAALRTQSGDLIDPEKDQITLALGTSRRDSLATLNSLGTQSVYQWLRGTYPNVRIVSAPELDGANGGANVFYMYAENVADSGTDDGRTFLQIVPAKFQTLGVEKTAKGYVEDYANATAGVFVKRPYAVVRRSGI